MTLEQCKRLKKMGFPQGTGVSAYWELSKDRIELWHTRNLHMATEICCNPTAEEALEWLCEKLDEEITISINKKRIKIIYEELHEYTCFVDRHNTLSDAVYALIEWAYENKLLEA